jgi:hypothetical protein
MKRTKLTKGKSARLFRRGDATHRKNISAAPMRGGIRL